MMSVVRPFITSRRASLIRASVEASTEAVASSRISTRGFDQQRPGDRDPLALAAREGQPALADARLVAVRQVADELVRLGLAGGLLDLLGGRPGRAVGDVLGAPWSRTGRCPRPTIPTCWRSESSVSCAHVGAVQQHAALLATS